MANATEYRFTRGNDGYIIFDSNGYILKAKGFSFLLWCDVPDIDKELVGKHADELAEMLKKKGINKNIYLEFETYVHLELLKQMLKNLKG